MGAFRIERLGNDRWLSTTLTPEQIFPQVRTFWKDNGFNLVQDRPEAGILETDWAENRAKLPQDFLRSTIGKVLDSAYSTGELDKFTTRVERTATGSDVFITHRGMAEVYVGQRNDSTVWQPRPGDPQLEAAFLARLMVKLGAKEEQARATVAAATTTPSAPARARLVEGQPTPTLQLDDNFDRAWRRVGIALDRSGFTVEDRDRGQGVYFVRYVDPASAGREEPSFFSQDVQPQEDRPRGTGQVPRQGQQRRNDDDGRRPRFAGQGRDGRSRHADHQPAPRRPALVTARPGARRPRDAGRRRP